MTLTRTEHEMTAPDGTPIFYRAWRPASPASKALILFHRGHEHSGRFEDLVERLGLEDCAVFAWDARGHGRSPGERGYADSFSTLVRDADAFVRHVCREHAIAPENVAVLSSSVGSVLAAAWVHDYAPPIRALVLANPAFRVKLYVPFALPLLRLQNRLFGKSFVKSYVKAGMLTHDPEQRKSYDQDPLVTRSIAVNVLIDVFDVSQRLLDDAGAIRVPTLLLTSGSDWVVRQKEQRVFFKRLGSPVKAMEEYPGFYHSLFHEKDRHLPIEKARRFILDAFSRPPESATATHTREEYRRISDPLPLYSPRRWNYAVRRLALKTLGRLSDGIRLGWRSGFDSGESLDYVYENRPRGKTLLGPVIDRVYLNSIGWKGIRQRKTNLQKVLHGLIAEVGTARKPVRLLDIASGPGRYLLETLQKSPAEATAILRDWSPAGIDAGRALARKMAVDGVTYDQGDAFDQESLSRVTPRPDVTVVSGLYELFPDDEKILASLRGVFQALSPGGYLVYTNQPWHPQVEMIARVLINRNGRPWIMRRRTQAEMDDLVRSTGFEKISTEIDPYGIFTVSVARKRSA
jgi:alpha-beta hydrolase superfamily lysophospholipase/ubiquinone/menaquinone biosynthesis C-methylase UbiE